MISVRIHLTALQDRIGTAHRLIDATHPSSGVLGVERESRGLAIVLLFAAYENLLTSLTRTLLEGAIACRVGNARLRPGFRALALVGAAKSTRDLSEKKLFTTALPRLIETAAPSGRTCTIDPGTFPSDGSFMKQSQIQAWCSIFGVPHPDHILFRTWDVIDTVVTERNGIAHGRLSPEDVGRRYAESDIRSLITNWHDDWQAFLTEVGALASSRDFFRKP